MKKTIWILLTLALALTLASCGCDHEWAEAGCVSPKTCALCGETEGEALGHSWAEATCQTPETCTLCGETQGVTLEHEFVQYSCETACVTCGILQEGTETYHIWNPATCIAPSTCACCGKTEGEADGNHGWRPATTEEPQTCVYCGLTEGEPLQVDPRFKTSACKSLFGSWDSQIKIPGSYLQFLAPTDPAICRIEFHFSPDGNLFFYLYVPTSKTAQTGALYEGVYYVEEGYLYIGRDWESPMTQMPLTILEHDDTTLYDNAIMLDVDVMTFCGEDLNTVYKGNSIDISGLELLKMLYDRNGNRINR